MESSWAATARKVIPAEIESDFLCTICQDLLLEPVAGVCGHQFCKHCLESWRVAKTGPGSQAVCPDCRGALFASSSQPLGVCRLLARMLQQTYPDRYAARLAEVNAARTTMQAHAQKQLGTHMAAVHELILGGLPGLRARTAGTPTPTTAGNPQHTQNQLTKESNDTVQECEKSGQQVPTKEDSQQLYQRRTATTELPPIVLVPTDGTAPVSVPATPATPLLPSLLPQPSPAVMHTAAPANAASLPVDTQPGGPTWVAPIATRLPQGRSACTGILPSTAPASVAQQKSQSLLPNDGSRTATAAELGPARKRQRQGSDMQHAPGLHALADIALQQRDQEMQAEKENQPCSQPPMVKPSKRSGVGKSGAPLPPLPRTKAASTGGAIPTSGRHASSTQQPMSPPVSMFSSLSSVFDGWASQCQTGGGSVIGCEPRITQNFVPGGPMFGPAVHQYQQQLSRRQPHNQGLEQPVSNGARLPLQPLQLNCTQNQHFNDMAACLDLQKPSATQPSKVTSASSNSLSAVSHTVTPLDLDLPMPALGSQPAGSKPANNGMQSQADNSAMDRDLEAEALITNENVLEANDTLQEEDMPSYLGQVLPQHGHQQTGHACNNMPQQQMPIPHSLPFGGQFAAARIQPYIRRQSATSQAEGDMKQLQQQQDHQLPAKDLQMLQLHTDLLQQSLTFPRLPGHVPDLPLNSRGGLHLHPLRDTGSQTLAGTPAASLIAPDICWDLGPLNPHAKQEQPPLLAMQPRREEQLANPSSLHDDQVRNGRPAAVTAVGMNALRYCHGRQMLFEQPGDSSHCAAAVSNAGCDDEDEVWPGAAPLTNLGVESISFAFGSAVSVHNRCQPVTTHPAASAHITLADEHMVDCQQPVGIYDTQEAADETDGEVAANTMAQACSPGTTPVHTAAYNHSLPGYMDTGCSAKKQRTASAPKDSSGMAVQGTDVTNAAQPGCVLSARLEAAKSPDQGPPGHAQVAGTAANNLDKPGTLYGNQMHAASALLTSSLPHTSAERQSRDLQATHQLQHRASNAGGTAFESAAGHGRAGPSQLVGISQRLSSLPPNTQQASSSCHQPAAGITQHPGVRHGSNIGVALGLAPNDRLRLSHPCLVKPGSWHNLERDIPMRMAVVQSIIAALLSKLPGRLAEDRLPAFHKCISKVEEVLYMGAASAEAYSDRSTLMTRFLALRKQLLDAAGRRAATA